MDREPDLHVRAVRPVEDTDGVAKDAGRGKVIDGPLLREYRAISARVAERREQADRLRAVAEALDEQTAREEHLLRELAGALDIDEQLRLERLDPTLRGTRLREVALQVLRSQEDPRAEIHYREWFELVRSAGHRIGGRDPLATFLAQVHRAEGVERVGQRTGRYRLGTG